MTLHPVPLALLCAATLSLSAWAQTPPPAPPLVKPAPLVAPPASSASSARISVPDPRLATPAEDRQSTSPGHLRPERPVTPQITTPIGRTAPPVGSRGIKPTAQAPGTIDDAAARCRAQPPGEMSADCQRRQSTQAPVRP